MTQEWTRMVDPQPFVRQLLTSLDTRIPYQVLCRWPRQEDSGTTITVTCITNRQDGIVTDQIAVQVDLWSESRDDIRALAPLVNAALCAAGFRRDFGADEEQISAPRWRWRRTFRYGGRVDKRNLRLMTS